MTRGLPRGPRPRASTRRSACSVRRGLLRGRRPAGGWQVHAAAARYAPRPEPSRDRAETGEQSLFEIGTADDGGRHRRPTTADRCERRRRQAPRAAATRESGVPAAPGRRPQRVAVRRRRCSTSTAGGCCCAGANGAGKSKTLEMLLPFALDGDKAADDRVGAPPHVSLLWLMLDGYDGQAPRARATSGSSSSAERGTAQVEHLTCGVGIRASASAKTRQRVVLHHRPRGSATTWCSRTTPVRSPQPRLQAAIGDGGQVFEGAAYKRARRSGPVRPRPGPLRRAAPVAVLAAAAAGRRGHRAQPAGRSSWSRRCRSWTSQAIRAAGDTFDELQRLRRGDRPPRAHRHRRASVRRRLPPLRPRRPGRSRAVGAQRARRPASAGGAGASPQRPGRRPDAAP